MLPNEFNALRDMLKKTSGLVLTDDKQYLIESRLAPVAKKLKFPTMEALVSEWRRTQDKTIQNHIVEAMTINESFFFRDKTPFDNFENVILPSLQESKKTQKHIRIWSAAASTGQEAYSLAMIMKEHAADLDGWRIEIIGTDLSSEALEKAKSGLYSQFEVQRGMPVKYLVKNFKQVGSMWQIDSNMRSKVQFRQFNLMNSFSILGRFDVIFCRNVLIYFDKDTKKDILQRMEKQTTSECFLTLGASETLVGLNEGFKPVAGTRSLYKINTQTNVATPSNPDASGKSPRQPISSNFSKTGT